MRTMIRTVAVVILVLIAGCNGDDVPWPPECGMSEDDLERHMEAARRLASGVLPSDVYDFDGNGAVDLVDLARLRLAGIECQ